MISFHLTKLSNLDSILKVGLLGSKPKLDHHLKQWSNMQQIDPTEKEN